MDVTVGERSARLGGTRPRIVLAMLALELQHVVSMERLIDAVWDQSPPPTARDQIQICVSRLRRELAGEREDVIVTHTAGYLLRLAPGELDLDLFDQLVAASRILADDGQLSLAADRLRIADSVWRGPALDGLTGRLMDAGRARLHERRMTAVEERIQLDLALGRHDELAGELLALVSEYPLRERLSADLMTALYRSGRAAEALEVYRRAREVYTEELGIEPGEELRRLEHAILNRDADLDLPRARLPVPTAAPLSVPRQLPADTADFTGRGPLAAEIGQLLSRPPGAAEPAGSRIVAISGPGGVGKSTLGIHVGHALSSRFAHGQLYVHLRGTCDAPTSPREVLARFLRALGVAGHAVPDGLDERIELYRSRLADLQVLVVLDDAANEEQVLPLIPGGAGCAMLVTSRAHLAGLPGAHLVGLEIFAPDEALGMLAKVVGPARVSAELGEAAELVRLCGHLPLALRIAGARLASRPHWPIAYLTLRLGDESTRLDELVHGELRIRTSIDLSYTHLGATARRLFRLLCLVEAADFDSWIAAPLLNCPPEQAENELERLVDARLMEANVHLPGRRVRYRFHELVRVYARECLFAEDSEADRDAATKRLLGAWMALAEEAHRREYGGDYTILHGEAPRWRLPQARVDRLLEQPMAWLESERESLVAAVHQAAGLGLDELCWDLAMTAMTLFEAHSHFDDWGHASRVALELTGDTGNRRGSAAMLHMLGALHLFQQRTTEAETCLTSALEIFDGIGDRHGHGLVLRNLAYLDRLHDDLPTAVARYSEAFEALSAVGDRIASAHVLVNIAQVRMDNGALDAARDLLHRALEICRAVGSRRVEAQALYRMGELALTAGNLHEAEQSFHWVLRIVRANGDQVGEAYATLGLGVVRRGQGRTEQAGAVLAEALYLARQLGERMVEARTMYALGELEATRTGGPVGGAMASLTEAARMFAFSGAVTWQAKSLSLIADLHFAAGETARGRAAVVAALDLLAKVDTGDARALRSALHRRKLVLPGGEATG